MPFSPSYHIYPCGDQAVTIEWGDKIDSDINEQVMALFAYLKGLLLPGVKDIIPAYHSLTIVYDMLKLKKNVPYNTVYEMICAQLKNAVSFYKEPLLTNARLVSIPVCYDLSFAPDLKTLAAKHSISIEEVIKLHTGKTYRVYMIGFLPGFAYLGTVDEKIITPRKSQPRTLVPAGSVGIAGEQTGIYPFDSPGGWQLIGRTPISLFSTTNDNPCYLQPGDNIGFYAISVSEFEKIKML